ncbi:MAG TPA: rhamnulokinase family protein [Micropruina sp.]|nr:rhamnulokinase family protein [Micropruina sp.]
MTTELTVGAVDLGASSGRVIVGQLTSGIVTLHPVARFANRVVELPDGLHWNLLGLYGDMLAGLHDAAAQYPMESIAIDTWAVDYGLLDAAGSLVGSPFAYRDSRTARGVEAVHAQVPFDRLYRRNGLQFLPFNTLYQLAAEPGLDDAGPRRPERLLLVPDLLAYWLTGRQVAEYTNASTTGLVDARSRQWDDALIAELALPRGIFPELVQPGTAVGSLRAEVVEEVGIDLQVLAAPTHDTASAVAGVPMDPARAAYISCGTWGLVGVELPAPVLTDAARAANFTNEGGVDGTIRFLHNVMGLWVLTETLRVWRSRGGSADLGTLLAAAAEVPAPPHLVDLNDERFLPPGDMAVRIGEWLAERGLPQPGSDVAIVRLIVESLAEQFADAVRMSAELSGVPVEQIHMVGGGCQNRLLCQLTADRSGLPVVAGPVEATALGNVLIQARTHGRVGSLEDIRQVIARSFEPFRYTPRRRGGD